MATIRFVVDDETTTVELPVAEGAPPPTLLAVARDHGVPLLFNCGTGDCGACLVEVEIVGGAPAPMSDAEAFYLRATGRLGKAGDGPHARLACQYKLSAGDDLRVRFVTNVGCI